MKRSAFWTFGIILLASCSACSIEIPTPSVQIDGVAQTRPESAISPNGTSVDGWRKVSMSISKIKIKAIHEMQSTFYVDITNCKGKKIGVEDLYVNGLSLNSLSTMQSKGDYEFKSYYDSIIEPAIGYVYIKESAYNKEDNICANFSGGSYSGFSISSVEFKIK